MSDTAVIDRVDPRALLTDKNIRTRTDLDDDFVGSIRELGVLERIAVVRTAGGQLRVVMGERRTLGAIKAGQADVPVEIIGDEAEDDDAEIQRRIIQYAENKHRRGLSAADEVRFVQGLFDLGVDEAQIRQRARMPEADLAAAARAARSKLAAAAVGRYEFLTLEMGAALAEFEDAEDAEAVKALVAAAQRGEGHFRQVLQRARDERAERIAYEATRAALEADGVVVLDGRPDQPAQPLGYMRLEEADHRDCPGHAARLNHTWVEETAQAPAGADDDYDDEEYGDEDYDDPGPAARHGHYEWRPFFYCLDPVTHGHITPPPAAAQPGAADGPDVPSAEDAAAAAAAAAEAETAERRRVLQGNKLWRSAETVRREWLRTFLSRKTAPAGAVTFVLAAVAGGSYELRKAMENGHEMAGDLLGLTRPAGNPWRDYGVTAAFEEAKEGRAQVIGLAVVLAAYEAQTGVHTWRNGAEMGRRYLTALAGWGYTLSEIEQYVVDGTDFMTA
ncbi:MAG: ParB/RepB/Spo0J family partition protein [Streptosporangiaceae bacterium]